MDPATNEITLWREWHGSLGTATPQNTALGGWDLSVHHSYDPAGQALYFGDGTRHPARPLAPTLKTLAGSGNMGFSGDGGQATSAALSNPSGLVQAADGTLYLSDTNNRRVRKVSPAGVISTFAGTGMAGSGGDGGAATAAQLDTPTDLALSPDGSLFILDIGTRRLRRVTPAGIISTVTGAGTSTADGVAATGAMLLGPRGLDIAPDGTIYLTDANIGTTSTQSCRLRKISPAGTITTLAGQFGQTCGFGGDGGPASAALLSVVWDVARAPDGSLYLSDTGNLRVRKIDPAGNMSTVAGDGQVGTSADRVLGTLGHLYLNRGIAVGADGAVYIADTGNNQVRRLGPDGYLTTVAGSQENSTLNEGGRATVALLQSPDRVIVDSDGAVYLSEAGWQRIRRVTAPFSNYYTELRIVSPDGSEVYFFNPDGRHLRTQDALTGVVTLTFGYDGPGRLLTLTDRDGQVTTIQRDGSGVATALVAPTGQSTGLLIDGSGNLTRVTNPAAEVVGLGYGAQGLLTGLTDTRGGSHVFTYDPQGRLTRDTDPAGGFKQLGRTGDAFASDTQSWNVGVTTAEGRTSSFGMVRNPHASTENRSSSEPGQGSAGQQWNGNNRTYNQPDGSSLQRNRSSDPRFFSEVLLDTSTTLTQPGLVSSQTLSRAVTLTDLKEPLGLSTQTDTLVKNGRTYTQSYTAATGTVLYKSPQNRQTTVTLNAKGRPATILVPGFLQVTYSYDPQGRLSQIVQGTRSVTYGYDSAGNLSTITDALGRVTTYGHDLAGRVVQQTLPDGRVILLGRDAAGNMTTLTPPGSMAHRQAFSPVDLLQSYTPPALGMATVVTQYSYNLDRQLTLITRPDGQALGFTYNPSGQLTTLSTPGGNITYTYDSAGRLATVADPGGVTVTHGYSGTQEIGQSWSGGVTGSVGRTYNNNLWVSSEQVNGANSISLTYDDDGLLVGAGAMTMTNDTQSPMLTGTTLGTVTDARTYNGYGSPATYEARAGGASQLLAQYSYDDAGRITQKSETVQGTNHVLGYTYDLAGRLVEVKQDGVSTATYGYDSNSNRLSKTANGTTINGTYDSQDRLTQWGSATYGYTANGELSSKMDGPALTTYSYDVRGNVMSATLPDGTAITYIVDGHNRRVGKRVGGSKAQGFLYAGGLRIVAELDGTDAVVSRFVYTGSPNAPEYMIKGGATYRIIKDHLGSPRLVIHSATGAVAQRMDYDEFGNVMSDSNPGFQPFGFAGGLYDRDTKLVRFGARDYDPQTGRWTAKDPLQFGGGDSNLYGYVAEDGINGLDVTGLSPGLGSMGPGMDPMAQFQNYLNAARGAAAAAEAAASAAAAGAVRQAAPYCAAAAEGISAATIGIGGIVFGVLFLAGDTPTTPGNGCPPCSPPSPGYSRTDIVPPSTPHHPCAGTHTHMYSYVTNQHPVTCECFENKREKVSCE